MGPGSRASTHQKDGLYWKLHNGNLDRDKTKPTTRVVLGEGAWLSGWVPDRILSYSAAARQVPVDCGGQNAGGAQ
jgi:hypothetical protein